MKKVRGEMMRDEKVKVRGEGERWWFAFFVAAAALVAPFAGNAGEFPGMNTAYAKRLERDRAISSLWLGPQALIGNDATSKGDATFLSREENSLHAARMPRLLCSPSPFTFTSPPNTISPWSAHGAYEDWVHIDLPETFRFPVGLDYLTRITILAYGEVRCRINGGEAHTGGEALLPRHNEDETSLSRRDKSVASPIAALPNRVSIAPNPYSLPPTPSSSVTHGLTPSNSYLIAWQNACVERSATNRVNAAIELFPDGSVVTTWQPNDPNQPPTTINQQPTPPPGFHGHGQDADWIRGNFALLQSFDSSLTNADEIISLGYDNWLTTRAVGIDQENGIYKVAITINQQPATNNQQPTYLICGPYKVIVTQPGTYHFPLEVFKHYPTRSYPDAMPLTIVYDDGFTDIPQPLSNAQNDPLPPLNTYRLSLNAKSAPPPENIYDVCMHPTFYLWPSTIALSIATSSSVTFKCNVPRSARVRFSSMWQATKIILRGSRLAEIEEAEVEDLVTVFLETADGTTSGSFAIVDDRPRHYCDDTCICPICEWCYSSTNRYVGASITNSCPCCTCP